MKSLLLTISALLISGNAMATSMITVDTVVLPTVKINGVKRPYVAVLQLDYTGKDMDLTIYSDICGHFTKKSGEQVCAAMPMVVTSFGSGNMTYQNSCGSDVYSAQTNRLPVDGNKVEMQYVNHTHSHCRVKLAYLKGITATVETLRGVVTIYEATDRE